ncbi:MAG TPA: L,D-transpeptidase [Polyangiaceae bacterium]|nr:L,D-transpeptidase [Polyangiaceae bacterium]
MALPSPPRRSSAALLALTVAPGLAAALACSGNELKLMSLTEHSAPTTTRVSALSPLTPAPPAPPAPAPTSARDAVPAPAPDSAPALTSAPTAALATDSDSAPPPDSAPTLLSTARETLVYSEPSRRALKVGYLRLGARIRRAPKVSGYDGCAQGWYSVTPYGFVCAGNAASKDVSQPLADLARTRPDREAALPYVYGRSKPGAPPLYTALPPKTDMLALEGTAPRTAIGFLDLPVRETPELAAAGRPLPTPFGYARAEAQAPVRALPNSGFALLDVLEHEGRRFGVTTDLELVPLDRLTRVEPSTFHGIALDDQVGLPLVFVRARHAALYAGSAERGLRQVRALGYREAVPVSGRRVKIDGNDYLETRSGDFLRDAELVKVLAPHAPPPGVREGRTWVHVSILDQTLVAYVGTRPVYATLVSTGAGGMGDPLTTHATPRGEFLIHTKHVTATMNGDELGDEFDLRDVPYVEFFTQGYAFHAAYWHDAFGTARSHGCVNLSPLDARWLFHFTEPAVPQGWHGAFSRDGTLVSVTP